MSLAETIAARSAVLPLEKQREILDFVEFLIHQVMNSVTPALGADDPQKVKQSGETETKSIFGLLADENIKITADDIAEARREMWGGGREEITPPGVPKFAAEGNEREVTRPAFRSVMGALARPGFDVTPEDIAEVRREMWQNFPREEPR